MDSSIKCDDEAQYGNSHCNPCTREAGGDWVVCLRDPVSKNKNSEVLPRCLDD